MRVAILTEGFQHTGYGHIYRCRAIADSFRRKNIDVVFIIHGDEQLKDILTAYPLHLFPWPDDRPRLNQLLEQADMALIDSYHAGITVYETIQNRISVCAYMDDYDRLEYPPGIVINGTVGADNIYKEGKSNPGLRYLTGSDYVILREPFRALPARSTIARSVNTVLITFGGSDTMQLTSRVLPVIAEYFPEANKIVVLGPAFKDTEKVEQAADMHTTIYRNIDAGAMKDLMLQADLAISAAGQTMNELAATGLPSIIFKVADNQTYNISGWIEAGFITSCIDATEGRTEDELRIGLRQMEDPEYRERLSVAGRNALDGKGSDRIVKEILKAFGQKQLQIRLAEECDLLPLFELANDREVRANSFSTQSISLAEHTGWFNCTLANPARKLFVFRLNGEPAGQVRFDKERDEAVIGVSLNARYRGMGWASLMIRKALDAYKVQEPYINRVYAFVKSANTASKYTFLNAGFNAVANEREKVLTYMYRYGKEFV